jgi:hypothetical protein
MNEHFCICCIGRVVTVLCWQRLPLLSYIIKYHSKTRSRPFLWVYGQGFAFLLISVPGLFSLLSSLFSYYILALASQSLNIHALLSTSLLHLSPKRRLDTSGRHYLMEAAPPASKQLQNVSFAPSHKFIRPSKSSSDLSVHSVHDLDATLRASTSTRLEDKHPSDSSEAEFHSFETTAVRTPSLKSLSSQKGKGKAPVLEITPPPATHHPRPRASNSFSNLSHHSQPVSDDSSDDLFYPRRSGSAPLSDTPLGAPFYQQEKNGAKIHSSPDLLLGPLLTDYYKSTATGFQPSAISTPPDNSPFSIRPPAHPSSLPLPRVSRPLFNLDPPHVSGPSSELDETFRIPTFSSFRRWLPNREDTLDVERLSEDSPSLAERERHASLGKKDEDSKFFFFFALV